MKRLCCLLTLLLTVALGTIYAADEEKGAVRELRIEPATTSVAAIGKARLIVEPLVHGEGGLHAPYRVEVSGLPVGGEEGQFKLAVTDAELHKLTVGQSLQFGGQAVSKDGNVSDVRGTATPGKGENEGTIKIKVKSKKGMLVFNTVYRLTR